EGAAAEPKHDAQHLFAGGLLFGARDVSTLDLAYRIQQGVGAIDLGFGFDLAGDVPPGASISDEGAIGCKQRPAADAGIVPCAVLPDIIELEIAEGFARVEDCPVSIPVRIAG